MEQAKTNDRTDRATAQRDHERDVRKARELLLDFKNGMLITRDRDGGVHARPMMIAEVDDDARVSFLTGVEGEKVEEVLRDPKVGVTLQKSGEFVALSGHAEVIVDPEQKQRVWSKLGEVWFDGPDDHRAGLIRVIPDTVEFWDNRGLNSLKFAFEALAAKVQDRRPEPDAKQHATLDLGR